MCREGSHVPNLNEPSLALAQADSSADTGAQPRAALGVFVSSLTCPLVSFKGLIVLKGDNNRLSLFLLRFLSSFFHLWICFKRDWKPAVESLHGGGEGVLCASACYLQEGKHQKAPRRHPTQPRASRIMWRGNWGLVLPSLRSYQFSFPFT